MTLEPIGKDRLRPGDILLCRIPKMSYWELISGELLVHYIATKQFDMKLATPFIHWVIGFLDGSAYCHASFWNGEKLVESRIACGLRENDISTYREDAVDVYRYHREGHWVGDASLPVDPLLRQAQALVDKHWPYGFDSGYLLAILCVSRWHRAEWVDRIRDLLAGHAHWPWLKEQIENIFDENRPQIDALIERLIVMALEVVRKYRDRKGLVCSQTVAVIYNHAADAEHPADAYKIDKPDYSLRAAAPVLIAAPSAEEEGADAWEEMTQTLRGRLAELPTSPDPVLSAPRGTDYEAWRAELLEDDFYTPRDLAESSNTKRAGRLDL